MHTIIDSATCMATLRSRSGEFVQGNILGARPRVEMSVLILHFTSPSVKIRN